LTNNASGNNGPGFLGFKDYHDFTEEKEYIFIRRGKRKTRSNAPEPPQG
jgi:hypothetical protein